MTSDPLHRRLARVLGLALALVPAVAAAQGSALVNQAATAPTLDRDPADTLARYLRVLAAEPNDLAALMGAGRAAVECGDPNAAIGFWGRADQLSPRNGRIKAGMAAALLQAERPKMALRLFDQAAALGIPASEFASDRGLAYDLLGNNRRAQKDYALALSVRNDPETVRRLALSKAMAGDGPGAIATLDPLLRKQDAAAWRARAFALALTGDSAGAVKAAGQVLPPTQAEAMAPFLAKLATLRQDEKAAAVHFGDLPATPGSGPAYAREDDRLPIAPVLSSTASLNAAEAARIAAADAAPLSNAPAPRVAALTAQQAPTVPARPAPAPRATGDGVRPAPNPAAETQIATAPRVATPAPITLARTAVRSSALAASRPIATSVPVPSSAAAGTSAPGSAPPPTVSRPVALASSLPAAAPLTAAPAVTPPAFAALSTPVLTTDPDVVRQEAPEPTPSAPAIERPVAPTAEQLASRPAPVARSAPAARVATTRAAPAKDERDAEVAPARATRTASRPATRLAAADKPATPPKTTERKTSSKTGSAEEDEPDAKEKPSKTASATREKASAKNKGAAADKLARNDKAGARDKSSADDEPKASGKAAAKDKLAAKSKETDKAKTADAKPARGAKSAKAAPERIWVQVAGGANRDDLDKEWVKLKKAAPDLYAGKSPHTASYRYTNRLLVGPFKSEDEAQVYVNKLAKSGRSGFTVKSEAGQSVDKLDSGGKGKS